MTETRKRVAKTTRRSALRDEPPYEQRAQTSDSLGLNASGLVRRRSEPPSREGRSVTNANSLRDALAQSVGKLAVLRLELSMRTERVREAREQFEKSIAEDLLAVARAKAAVEAEEASVRGMALVEFANTQDAKPATGVSVVQSKRFTVDEVEGFKWAKAHGLCLIPESLDVKAAQKMASVTPLPFVTVTLEPSVRIATDLFKAIDDAIAECNAETDGGSNAAAA